MTATRVSSARAPGKVMLAGEYSVLNGAEALAATVDLDLVTTVTALLDTAQKGCRVRSDLWSEAHLIPPGTSPEAFPTEPLLAAVAHGMQLYGVTSVEISVRSALPITYGIGSSSALRLAVLSAMQDWARQQHGEPSLNTEEQIGVAREAFALQRSAQKQASGYDVVTQLCGGLVCSRGSAELSHWPLAVHSFNGPVIQALSKLVHVYVGGSGAPTASMLASTQAWLTARQLLQRLDHLNTVLAGALVAALLEPSLAASSTLYQVTGEHRQLFAASPHFPHRLAAQLAAVPGCDRSWSFKTTGAGGEDALLLIGPLSAVAEAGATLHALGWQPLPATFTDHGLRLSRTAEGTHG